MGLLGERVERDLAACERDRRREVPRGFRASGHPLQQRHHLRAVLVASLVDPVVVEVLEQLAPRELERILEPALRDEPLELAYVCPDLIGAGEGDSVAGGQQVAIGVGAQRATQSRQGAAQARARALVEHVGPEARRELAARVRAPLQGKQAEQRTRPPARRQLQMPAVHLERQLPQQLDAQHGRSLRGFARVSRAFRAGATEPWDSCSPEAQPRRETQMATEVQLDQEKLEAFVERIVLDVGTAMRGGLMYIGDRLGIFAALAESGPVTAAELAAANGPQRALPARVARGDDDGRVPRAR